jgi:hypothetical protein
VSVALLLRRIVFKPQLSLRCSCVHRIVIVFISHRILIAHCVVIVSCFCERAFGTTVASSMLAVVLLVPCIRFFMLCHVNLLLSSLAAGVLQGQKVWKASFSKELSLRFFFKCLLFMKCYLIPSRIPIVPTLFVPKNTLPTICQSRPQNLTLPVTSQANKIGKEERKGALYKWGDNSNPSLRCLRISITYFFKFLINSDKFSMQYYTKYGIEN